MWNMNEWIMNKKYSVNDFVAKFKASVYPSWCHMRIQNHTVEVNARVHQQRSGEVFGSHGKIMVSGSYLRHINNVRDVSFI